MDRSFRVGLNSFEKLYGPLDRLPGVMSAGHVACVEAGLSQRHRRLASDMEAVNTVGDDGLGLGKLADPLVQALRIPPHGAVHDVLCLGGVVLWPRVDDLNGRPRF